MLSDIYEKLKDTLFPKYVGYLHFVQLGDPILRQKAEEVPIDQINSQEIQSVIKTLRTVINNYNACGVAAPQIGVPYRIICVQYTEKQFYHTYQGPNDERGIAVIPQTILINPSFKVLDKTQLIFREGCRSIHGYGAFVPRYKTIQVEAYNENGDPITHVVHNWTARIFQHEIDHLDGSLYIDKMLPDTFEFEYWENVNHYKGDFELYYGGIKSMFRKIKHTLELRSLR